jgi:predicted small lipoprotein YifL
LPDFDLVKLSHALLSSLCFALAACGQQGAPQADKPVATTGSSQPQSARKPSRLTAEDIARIKATGKTGLWTDNATEICDRGNRATLTWNVEGRANKVVIMLVNRKGNERMFGGGSSIGQKQTGKWVKPGMSFKLLNAADRAELGSIAFTGKKCG